MIVTVALRGIYSSVNCGNSKQDDAVLLNLSYHGLSFGSSTNRLN